MIRGTWQRLRRGRHRTHSDAEGEPGEVSLPHGVIHFTASGPSVVRPCRGGHAVERHVGRGELLSSTLLALRVLVALGVMGLLATPVAVLLVPVVGFVALAPPLICWLVLSLAVAGLWLVEAGERQLVRADGAGLHHQGGTILWSQLQGVVPDLIVPGSGGPAPLLVARRSAVILVGGDERFALEVSGFFEAQQLADQLEFLRAGARGSPADVPEALRPLAQRARRASATQQG